MKWLWVIVAALTACDSPETHACAYGDKAGAAYAAEQLDRYGCDVGTQPVVWCYYQDPDKAGACEECLDLSFREAMRDACGDGWY